MWVGLGVYRKVVHGCELGRGAGESPTGRAGSGAGDARGASYHVDRVGTFALL